MLLFVQIMDTPRPDQVRTPLPNVKDTTDKDCLELMEMILGALGRDALGLGAGIAHPKESDQWKQMNINEKYGFFAPIWRVMRGENISEEEVKNQIHYVALSVKQGSAVSDMRVHHFSGKLLNAKVGDRLYCYCAVKGLSGQVLSYSGSV